MLCELGLCLVVDCAGMPAQLIKLHTKGRVLVMWWRHKGARTLTKDAQRDDRGRSGAQQ